MLSGFMKEMAVGAGIGARIDVSFFILRFDLAIPLRKPWLEDGQRWVTDLIDFTDPAWRTGEPRAEHRNRLSVLTRHS